MANNLTGKNLDFLDSTGESPDLFESKSSISNVDKLISLIAKKFIGEAQSKIKRSNAIDRGNLMDIKILANQLKGGNIELQIGYTQDNPAYDYWDFQDKGVRGVKKNKTKGSPYQYKKLTVGGKFLSQLIAWYGRHKNYIKNETQRKNLSSLQKKRKTLGSLQTNKIKSIAYATGIKIKKEGLSTLNFRKEGINKSFNNQFYAQLAKEFGTDILINLQQ